MKVRSYLLFFVFLLSCSKERTLNISGYVRDVQTDSPLSGIEVELFETQFSNGTIISAPRLLSQSVSQSDGRFALTSNSNVAVDYTVEVDNPNYFLSSKIFLPEELSFDTDNELNIDLIPAGLVTIRLSNNSLADANFRFFKRQGTQNLEGTCPNTSWVFDGYFDTVMYCKNEANTYFVYETWVINQGASEITKDSIFVQQGLSTDNDISITL